MLTMRRALVFTSLMALLGTTPLVAQRGGNARTGLTDAQRKAVESILAVANDAQAGKPMPNDLGLAWVHDDLLKVTQQGQAFVPFILTIDSAKTAPGPVSVYWRVVSKSAPPPAPVDPKDKKAPPPPSYAYESLSEGTVTAGQPTRISRSFTTPAGSYDVYVVVKEGTPSAATDKNKDKNAPAPKVAVIKQSVDVPDLWNGELATSSVILAEKLEPLSAALSPQEKVSRPYALGGAEIVPYTKRSFTKRDGPAILVLIYNAKMDTAGKPDLKAEFTFYSKQAGGEKYFNKGLDTNLNGNTMTAQDLAAASASGQFQAGQAVRFDTFPEGEYRLEIKVTDGVAKKTITRDVNFTIAGS